MASKSVKHAIIICGPTASGKSALATKIAKEINGCIINSDSMQVYTDLEVITSSPSTADKREISHLLYNFVDSNTQYSVANYIDDAKKAIVISLKNNYVPIFTGGTGMYINALINGISSIPKIPKEIRLEAEEIIKKKGLGNLYQELEILDKNTAKILNKNDSQRIIRAYSVKKFTGNSILSYRNLSKKSPLLNISTTIFYMKPEREFLYKSCNDRFVSFIENGAIEEIESFLKTHQDVNCGPTAAIGFQELKSYIRHEISIEAAIALAQTKTRQYAKRQNTWFKNQLKHKNQIIEFSSKSEFLMKISNIRFDF